METLLVRHELLKWAVEPDPVGGLVRSQLTVDQNMLWFLARRPHHLHCGVWRKTRAQRDA
jgi:hypothetical protein